MPNRSSLPPSAKHLLEIASLALACAQEVLPAYGHRFAPKKFTQPQLAACMVLVASILEGVTGGHARRHPLEARDRRNRRVGSYAARLRLTTGRCRRPPEN